MIYYLEFKVYGFNWFDMINVSMEFDEEIFKLMYWLLVGIFGWSNVFDIV